MYIVVCPICGVCQNFADDDVLNMEYRNKYGFIEKGLPDKIYCGSCEIERENQPVCRVIKI